jgi:hypothetical protein
MYFLKKVTSDCGRSLLLWLLWSAGLIGLFTTVHYYHRADWFNQGNLNWFSALYLNITRFMIIRLENVMPDMGHTTSQIYVITEVLVGYIMFCGFISILINKLAKKA